ncbi:uncharacterized protein METZ01_LOCUS213667, partial [marine metagenome]
MIVKPLEQARITDRPLSGRVHDNQLKKGNSELKISFLCDGLYRDQNLQP